MDPALLKMRESFLKKASSQPSVSRKPEKRKLEEKGGEEEEGGKSSGKKAAKKQQKSAMFPAQGGFMGNKGITPTTASAAFGVLAKIVDHMKKRHLEQLYWGLTLDEILEEVSMFDIPNKTRNWLVEVLPQNQRMRTDEEGKFLYKPPHKLGKKNPRNGLLNILKKFDLDGKGGILLSELADSVANPEKLIQKLGDAVVELNTAVNKRKDKVLFYNDPETRVEVEEEFKQLWRGTSVDHLDEKKIEEYLQKHGMESMRDLAPKKNVFAPPKRKARKKAPQIQNDHLGEGVLQDYSTPS